MSRLFALVIALSLFLSGCTPSTPVSQPTPKVEPPPPPAPVRAESPYTGLKFEPQLVNRRPIAVMIDNSPKARPQHGLNAASVVYEMLAEGGITRYMALFLEGEADVVGPVRSARHYFVYTASGHGAVYAHCGGSPQAFAEIGALKIPNFDDMKDRGIYVRSKDRSAPHNLYTSTSVVRKEMVVRSYEMSEPPKAMWKFTDDVPAGKPVASITIPYPGGYQGYTVAYEYDAEGKTWKRNAAGSPHVDARDDKQITAKTVLVLYTKSWPIPKDPELRIEMEIVGQGNGLVYANGTERQIKWSKDSKSAQFTLTETSGDPLTMQRGNVWIQVVPLETIVETK